MGGYLVDTNVISELMKPQPNDCVVDWLELNSDDLELSSITVKELYYGALRMPDGAKKDRILATVENIAWLYEQDIRPFGHREAIVCARLHDTALKAGRTPQIEDLMIAAIALCNECIVVTRNVKDFDYLGVPIINLFKEPPGTAR